MVDTKPLMDDEAFAALEQEFEGVLEEIRRESGMERVQDQYEKLLETLRKSHSNERRLMLKCRELNAELVANSAKVQSALQTAQEDDSTTHQLQKEVDEAWKLVDQGREKELQLKEKIERLQDEIAQLHEEVDDRTAEAESRQQDVQEMLNQKKGLETERDNYMEEIVSLRKEINQLTVKQQETEKAKEEVEAQLDEANQHLSAKASEIERQERRQSHLEREIEAKKSEIQEKEQDIAALTKQVAEAKQTIEHIKSDVSSRTSEADKLRDELRAASRNQEKLQRQLNDALAQNKTTAEEIKDLKADIKRRQEEVAAARKENVALEKAKDTIQLALQKSEEKRQQLQMQKDEVKNEVSALERELNSAKRQTEMDRTKLEDLMRTRDVLTKKMMQAGKETEAQEALVKMHESQVKNLEMEITQLKEEAAAQRKTISQLEKERDRRINEASAAQAKQVEALEDIKMSESRNLDLKKRLAQTDGQLRQQQTVYEAIRADRNMYSKNLVEAQDEIGDLKRKLKMLSHQIEQLKDEISSKDAQLEKELSKFESLETQKQKLKSELDKLKSQNTKLTKSLQSQESEQDSLRKLVAEADDERLKHSKELEKVISERDALGGQLVKRNEELAAVYEKLRIQQSALSKGETQYRERMEDIRALKLEVQRLQRQEALLSKNTNAVSELKQELLHAQKQLLKEKSRARALEEEMTTPMNVHRWRQLEGSDPAAYEMLQKMQTLQKRLIQKTDEVAQKDLQLRESEKQYMDLKASLARQPGPEVTEQLKMLQQSVKDKSRQLRAMASEVNMYQAQINEHKFEIERLTNELQDMKKKYFDLKRKEVSARERGDALLAQASSQGNHPVRKAAKNVASVTPRVGGGFNLTTTLPALGAKDSFS